MWLHGCISWTIYALLLLEKWCNGFVTTRVYSAMIGKPMIDLKNIIMTGYISEAIASKANGMKWGEVVLYKSQKSFPNENQLM